MDPDRWQKVKEVYRAALELPVEDRHNFIVDSCGDDVELINEVERLLDMPDGHTGDIERIVGDESAAVGGALTQGERLGPYKLIDIIGRGGMGQVYLAERADDEFEQRVAIKTIGWFNLSPTLVERFQQERQILATLDHPNIARLLDGGRSDKGVPYLVMEYIEGKPFLEYCRSSNLPLRERLSLFLQICDAVRYAHRQLVIHRDIKPNNILVADGGAPKLLDFGIAKLIDAGADNKITRADSRPLTPEYASPEQVRGETATISTDVYGLGLLLYQLLTDAFPYDVTEKTSPEIAELICHSEPTAPSRVVASGQLPVDRSRLKGDLDNIVLKCLRKEPVRRYESVAALANDIENFLENRPVAARTPSLRYRTRKFLARNSIATAATVSALVAIVSMTVYHTQRLADERDVAQTERETAEAVADFMIDIFSVNDPSQSKGETLTAREVLDNGAEQLETGLEDSPEIRSRLLFTLGRVYERLGDYDQSEQFLNNSVELQRSIGRTGSENYADSLKELAWIHYRRENWDAAYAAANEALELRLAAYPEDVGAISDLLNNLGTIAYWIDEMEASIDYYQRALALDVGDDEDTLIARTTTLNHLGIVYDYLGRDNEAEEHYLESLRIREEVLEPDHPLVATAYANLGTLYVNVGRTEEAEEYMLKALEIDRKTKGEEHFDVAFDLMVLSNVFIKKREYKTAIEYGRDAAAIFEQVLGKKHTRYAGALDNIAESYVRLEQGEEALPYSEESLVINMEVNGPEHTETANAMYTHGRALRLIGQFDEARELTTNAKRIREEKLGRPHPAYWDTQVLLARIDIDENKLADANARLNELLSETPDAESRIPAHYATVIALLDKLQGMM